MCVSTRKSNRNPWKNSNVYNKYFSCLDTIIQESDAGSPCHDGTEETAPTGAYTCNQNVSICLGNYYFQDTFNMFWSIT